ncbi:Zn-ribbon domain-containing OB-fold protein [Actinomadura sp. ATCC 31491]|uniref:Zn-ribbon domain-containing OB-fold protein n=1 Tax=Actinomadura luzonensis TaxID=2805427 RepID=A0ABT0G570_9ACTN|nr:Zn-ribbon domain-containing OB-fold protein [Actinomadura luzonensis]MCK2219543.1 Zn-ribbon domain-containing OB-fold protein [Actinomadura luzonensis]
MSADTSTDQPAAWAAYQDACRRGELVVQRCAGCGRWVQLPEAACPWCGSGELAFEPVAGTGEVHTFTVVHRSFAPGYQGREPYVMAWVDLAAGVRAFGHIVGCAPEEVRVGMPVRVTFVDELPHWRPA